MDYRSPTMKKIKSTNDLKQEIKQRSRKNNSVQKDVDDLMFFCVRIAIGKKHEDDKEYEFLSDDDEDLRLESQSLVYQSPASVQKKKSGRSAGTSVDIDTEKLIHSLYEDEVSPYFHGLTREMVSTLRSRCSSKAVVDAIKASMEDGGWPTVEELFVTVLQPHEQPVKGK